MDKNNEYKTNLPYGFTVVDGKVQVNESKKAVSEWMFDAASRYLADIPQAVVEEVQSHYFREEDSVITMEEATEKVTFSMIEQYIATELNFRLKDFNPDLKVSELERIQEKLDRALSAEEVKSICANYKMGGQEYSKAIAKHFIFDNPNAKVYAMEGLKAGEPEKDGQRMAVISHEIGLGKGLPKSR